ncbi:MAG: DUF1822 family protein [Nodosilinea sp.]
MTDNLLTLDLSRVYLEIDAAVQQRAWQDSRGASTPASRWNSYLNQICIDTVLPWLEAESTPSRALTTPKPPLLPTIWELVTGSAVEVGPGRLILLPTESIDLETLEVPQEWVDIPTWVGDYYLTLQVNLDEGWLHVANFATHRQLKEKAEYSWQDRVYRQDASDTISDLNVLWVAQALYPAEVKRVAVAALPWLAKAEASSLIQRLGQTHTTPIPRLAIPFERWGALLAHGGWRRQLAETRWGRPSQPSVLDWLSASIDRVSQQVGWQAVSYEAVAAARGHEGPQTQTALSRQVLIAGGTYLLQISPSVDQGTHGWRFELRNAVPAGQVPAGLTLRLLTEDLQPFENNEVTATEPIDSIFIDVELMPSEGIVWDTSPTADQYDAEILRF